MPSHSQKPRAAIYARVSTGTPDAQMQLDELRIVVAQQGFDIAGEYVDTIIGSKEGPERARLMADAHQRKFAHVFVDRLHRLGTSKDVMAALDTLTGMGIGFTSVQEDFDSTSSAGRTVTAFLRVLSDADRTARKEMIVAGLVRARQTGKTLGRPRREVDVARAKQMMKVGRSLRATSKALRIPRATLRRALSRET